MQTIANQTATAVRPSYPKTVNLSPTGKAFLLEKESWNTAFPASLEKPIRITHTFRSGGVLAKLENVLGPYTLRAEHLQL